MTVLVIGGGASGMAAALTAAEAGHRVLLAERQSRVGRKLLATGNGRCNLSNLHASPAHYHGAAVDFCRPALECFPSEETLGWFERLGLLTAAEPSGRVYPASNMAGSVLDVLRYALERPEIELRTGCVITQLRHRGGAFTARMENGETLTAERVILAAGGAAGSRDRCCRDAQFSDGGESGGRQDHDLRAPCNHSSSTDRGREIGTF